MSEKVEEAYWRHKCNRCSEIWYSRNESQRTAITKSASHHIGTRKECADIMTSMFFKKIHYNQWHMFTKHSTVQNQSSIVGDLSVSTLEFCF